MSENKQEPRTIPQICAAWLAAQGYDGLCDPEEACGCEIADLMPCDMTGWNQCVAGHKERPDGGGWEMRPGKATDCNGGKREG